MHFDEKICLSFYFFINCYYDQTVNVNKYALYRLKKKNYIELKQKKKSVPLLFKQQSLLSRSGAQTPWQNLLHQRRYR
jgi:hypothetical protein